MVKLLLLLIILILVNAFLAASEVSVVSLNKNRLREAFAARRGSAVGARWRGYVGQPFRIIARVRPAKPCPMWVIEFANGFRMAAYAEEIFEEA